MQPTADELTELIDYLRDHGTRIPDWRDTKAVMAWGNPLLGAIRVRHSEGKGTHEELLRSVPVAQRGPLSDALERILGLVGRYTASNNPAILQSIQVIVEALESARTRVSATPSAPGVVVHGDLVLGDKNTVNMAHTRVGALAVGDHSHAASGAATGEESSDGTASKVFMDLSVVNADASSWQRGDDTILRYSAARNADRVKIQSELGYLNTFNAGGPIRPVSYNTPAYCAFYWDFPTLDFKILNSGSATIFLTEIVLDVEHSCEADQPLIAIRKDVQQRQAGHLLLVNEGWADITDLEIAFHILPGLLENPPAPREPYPHSVTIPVLSDSAAVEVIEAFGEEGVDLERRSVRFLGSFRAVA